MHAEMLSVTYLISFPSVPGSASPQQCAPWSGSFLNGM